MNYEKITKAQARKMYSEGKRVFCLPSKICTNSTWWLPAEIKTEQTFDWFCNTYKYYNCNAETGKRIAFYKEENPFEPRQRTALDGKVWWVVYDRYKQEFSTLTCFGKYKTKKDCQAAIDNYKEVI